MKKIIMYSVQNCPYCEEARNYLKEKGYSYEEIDVNKNKEAFQDLVRRQINGVPAFVIDDLSIEGFKPEKIEELMGVLEKEDMI